MAAVCASTIVTQARACAISGRRQAPQARVSVPPPLRHTPAARRAVVVAAQQTQAPPENLTAESFDALMASEPAVLLDFYTSWCGPCKILAGAMKKLEPSYEGKVKFMKIDCEKNFELTKSLEVKALPTLMFYKEGKLVERWAGVMSAQDLDLKLRTLLK